MLPKIALSAVSAVVVALLLLPAVAVAAEQVNKSKSNVKDNRMEHLEVGVKSADPSPVPKQQSIVNTTKSNTKDHLVPAAGDLPMGSAEKAINQSGIK